MIRFTHKILETILKYSGYGSVELLRVMIRLHELERPADGPCVFKYHAVILSPQLSAEEIESCTKYAPLVGFLSVGNELDDLVRQTVLAYITVCNFPSLFLLAPYTLGCIARVKALASRFYQLRWFQGSVGDLNSAGAL